MVYLKISYSKYIRSIFHKYLESSILTPCIYPNDSSLDTSFLTFHSMVSTVILNKILLSFINSFYSNRWYDLLSARLDEILYNFFKSKSICLTVNKIVTQIGWAKWRVLGMVRLTRTRGTYQNLCSSCHSMSEKRQGKPGMIWDQKTIHEKKVK